MYPGSEHDPMLDRIRVPSWLDYDIVSLLDQYRIPDPGLDQVTQYWVNIGSTLDLDLALVWVRLAVQAGHQWFQHRHSIDPILYANMTNLV